MKKSVGYNIAEVPEKVSEDDHKCPYHGETAVRGRMIEGVVVSDAMMRTVKVEREMLVRDKKFNRYYKKQTKVTAHNPDAVGAKEGDHVLLAETRPLSKTKHFTVLKVLTKNESGEEK